VQNAFLRWLLLLLLLFQAQQQALYSCLPSIRCSASFLEALCFGLRTPKQQSSGAHTLQSVQTSHMHWPD
jgi:hypothetical protein